MSGHTLTSAEDPRLQGKVLGFSKKLTPNGLSSSVSKISLAQAAEQSQDVCDRRLSADTHPGSGQYDCDAREMYITRPRD